MGCERGDGITICRIAAASARDRHGVRLRAGRRWGRRLVRDPLLSFAGLPQTSAMQRVRSVELLPRTHGIAHIPVIAARRPHDVNAWYEVNCEPYAYAAGVVEGRMSGCSTQRTHAPNPEQPVATGVGEVGGRRSGSGPSCSLVPAGYSSPKGRTRPIGTAHRATISALQPCGNRTA